MMKTTSWLFCLFSLRTISTSAIKPTNAPFYFEDITSSKALSNEQMLNYCNEKRQRNIQELEKPSQNNYFETFNRLYEHRVKRRPRSTQIDTKNFNAPILIKFEVSDAVEPNEEVKQLLRQHYSREIGNSKPIKSLKNARTSNSSEEETAKRTRRSTTNVIKFQLSDEVYPQEIALESEPRQNIRTKRSHFINEEVPLRTKKSFSSSPIDFSKGYMQSLSNLQLPNHFGHGSSNGEVYLQNKQYNPKSSAGHIQPIPEQLTLQLSGAAFSTGGDAHISNEFHNEGGQGFTTTPTLLVVQQAAGDGNYLHGNQGSTLIQIHNGEGHGLQDIAPISKASSNANGGVIAVIPVANIDNSDDGHNKVFSYNQRKDHVQNAQDVKTVAPQQVVNEIRPVIEEYEKNYLPLKPDLFKNQFNGKNGEIQDISSAPYNKERDESVSYKGSGLPFSSLPYDDSFNTISGSSKSLAASALRYQKSEEISPVAIDGSRSEGKESNQDENVSDGKFLFGPANNKEYDTFGRAHGFSKDWGKYLKNDIYESDYGAGSAKGVTATLQSYTDLSPNYNFGGSKVEDKFNEERSFEDFLGSGQSGFATDKFDKLKQYASGYAFDYRIQDFNSGNDFGHKQDRDSFGVTRGQYHILLPDGRVQNVIYKADKTGFHADVTYELGRPSERK